MSDSLFLLEDFANAIVHNDLSRIELLLANGSIDANARLPRALNPPALVFAADLGLKDVVDLLFRFGARIDDTDDDGYTACHAAARGHADVLELLLAHHPDLGLECKSGRTPLQYSFIFDGGELISIMLIEAGASLDGVERHFLCQLAAHSTSAIRTLLRRGVVVKDLRDLELLTPLHLTVTRRRPESAAIRHMLVNECDVDLEVRSVWGATCIHTAQIYHNADAVRFLIAAGADVQPVNTDTPLHSLGSIESTSLLLAAGADVHARNESGRTPLHALAWDFMPGSMPIVHMMLAVGADLDAIDRYGYTARQFLADRGMPFEDDDLQVEAVDAARRRIANVRLDFVRHRAWQVCIGLQSRGLDALQMCEVLLHSCGPVAPLIPFHQWWKIATTVKHFTTPLLRVSHRRFDVDLET
jgi:ankyrin repeat protein